jgi:hypothetical protein
VVEEELVRRPAISSRAVLAVTHRCQVDDHGDVLVALAGVPPDMFIDADHADAVEPVRVADQHSFALGQHRIVGGVPTDVQALSDPGHGQVLHHQAFQRPPQRPPRQPGPRLGRSCGVLAPHVTAAGAPVTADRDLQHGRSPAERFMSEPTHHRVTHHALAAAPSTPLILLDDPTGEHRPLRLQALPDHHQTKLIHAAERGHIRAREGSVSTPNP